MRLLDGVTALVGNNNSGKTTTLQLLKFAMAPTQTELSREYGRLLGNLAAPWLSPEEKDDESPLLYFTDPPNKSDGFGFLDKDASLVPRVNLQEAGILSEEGLNDSTRRSFRKAFEGERVGFAIDWTQPEFASILHDARQKAFNVPDEFANLKGRTWADVVRVMHWLEGHEYDHETRESFEILGGTSGNKEKDEIDFGPVINISEDEWEVRERRAEVARTWVEQLASNPLLNLVWRQVTGEFEDLLAGDIPPWAPFLVVEDQGRSARESPFPSLLSEMKVISVDFEVDWKAADEDSIRMIIEQVRDGQLREDLLEAEGDRDSQLKAVRDSFSFELRAELWLNESSEESSFEKAVADFFERATEILRLLVPTAPVLSAQNDNIVTVAAEGLEIRADGRSISLLSDTMQRWAYLALSLGAHPNFPTVLLIDEPERGLGYNAQMHLAGGLAQLNAAHRVSSIIATHSAAMISDPDTRVISLPFFHEIEALHRKELEHLDFGSVELLAFYRTTILVEGFHEEVVFDALLGSELANHRCHVLPYRGTKELSAAALDDLFLFSDARFVITSDRTRTEFFNRALDEARKAPNKQTAQERLEELLGELSQEERALKALLIRAVTRDMLHRIHAIVGIDADDILDYLPVDCFTDAGSWQELREAHRKARSDGVRNTPNDFKQWLVSKHNVDFSEEQIRSAASKLDELPSFVNELLEAIS